MNIPYPYPYPYFFWKILEFLSITPLNIKI